MVKFSGDLDTVMVGCSDWFLGLGPNLKQVVYYSKSSLDELSTPYVTTGIIGGVRLYFEGEMLW